MEAPFDPGDDQLSPYRSLKRHRQDSATFICEGRWIVENLLASPILPESAIVVRGTHDDLVSQFPASIPVFRPNVVQASTLVGFDFHRGVLACARRPETSTLLREHFPLLPPDGKGRRLLIICPKIADGTNFGAIVRNAAAFGATAVVTSQEGADPWSRKSIRASAGGIFKIPIICSQDLEHDLTWLRESRPGGTWDTLATVLDDNATPLPSHVPSSHNTALLLGAEDTGLSAHWLTYCSHQITIPIIPGIDSLNVSCSAAICLFHLSETQIPDISF